MPKIVGALLVRDEADRYLTRALDRALELCDNIVVVDDGSTDHTPQVLASYNGKLKVTRAEGEGFWKEGESEKRQLLWSLASREAGEDGWILVFDADQEILGLDRPTLQTLCQSAHLTCWSLPLYDCWDDENLMRGDGFWQAHFAPRPWIFKARPYQGFVPEWGKLPIHSGHCPANFPIITSTIPGIVGWRHLGYIKKSDRLTKLKKYLDLGLCQDVN